MTINFNSNDRVRVKQGYVRFVLRALNTVLGNVASATLGTFGECSSTVIDTGSVVSAGETLSFIKLLPIDTSNTNYNNGNGRIIYFASDALLNNCFEPSTSVIPDIRKQKVLNVSGGSLPALSVVRLSGFNVAQQLPTVALADASVSATASVFGIIEATIADGETGSCVVEGSISGLDTSAFTLNSLVYVSDTAGAISSTPGSVAVSVGRAISIDADDGCVFVKGNEIGDGAGSGSAGLAGAGGITGFWTGGATGAVIQGQTGIQGTTGLSIGPAGPVGGGSPATQGITGFEPFPFVGVTAGFESNFTVPGATNTTVDFDDIYHDVYGFKQTDGSNPRFEVPSSREEGYYVWYLDYLWNRDVSSGDFWFIYIQIVRSSATNLIFEIENVEKASALSSTFSPFGIVCPPVFMEAGDYMRVLARVSPADGELLASNTIAGGYRVF